MIYLFFLFSTKLSTTLGSARVVVSPNCLCSFDAIFLSILLIILPDRVFGKLGANCIKSGVAIAHPHPETIAALNRLIPLLAELDIDLVPISTLIDSPKKRQAYTEISDE